MRTRNLRRLALLGLFAVGAAACGGSDDTEATTPAAPATTPEAPATTPEAPVETPAAPVETPAAPVETPAAPVEMTKLVLGAVPTLDLGAIGIGREQGIFEKAGIEIELVYADGGPAVVTGVISGQYDIGYTAWTPPLLAVAGKQPLRLVSGVAVTGPEGTNGVLLVKADSGFDSFDDLNGKKVASNAPRSVLTLVTQAAVTAAGGDGNSLEIVPLPFGEIARAVAEGTVDAGITVEPFATTAKTEFPDVTVLGDPTPVVQAVGDPSTLIFSSADTLDKKADAIARFKAAFAEALAYGNEHPDDVRRLGAELTEVPPAAADIMQINGFQADVDAARLQPLVDAMLNFKWVEAPIDLTEFLG